MCLRQTVLKKELRFSQILRLEKMEDDNTRYAVGYTVGLLQFLAAANMGAQSSSIDRDDEFTNGPSRSAALPHLFRDGFLYEKFLNNHGSGPFAKHGSHGSGSDAEEYS